MPISYAPSGRRVGLEGPNSRGFNPVQAVDSSRSTERQGLIALDSFAKAREVDLANRAKNLEGLIGLSETATKFFVERQQGINENDRKLGIADILNGDMKPKPEALLEYRANTQTLKEAAAGEQQGLAQLETTDREAALEIRAKDPVVNAWRSYGQAQGTAMKAASSAEFLLTNAMGSMEENVPIVQADGSTRMIAPGKAKSPSELNAAWAVVLQGFINTSGLDGLNPLLIAENVSPKIMEIRAKVFDQGLSRIAKAQQEEALETTLGYFGAAVKNTDLTDPVAIHGLVQDAVVELTNTGMSRGKANETIYPWLLQEATDVDVVTRIENTPIAADGSLSMGTFGTRFPGLAAEAREKIIRGNEIEAERRKKAEELTVENVVTTAQAQMIDVQEPAQREALWTRTKNLLQQMSEDGVSGATAALVKWDAVPRRLAGPAYLDALVAKSIRNPGSVSKASIEKAIAEGYLEPGALARFDFPTDAVEARAKQYDALADREAKAVFVAQLRKNGWRPEDVDRAGTGTRAFLLAAEWKSMIRQGLAQDPNFSQADAISMIEKGKTKAATDPIYLLDNKRSGPGMTIKFQADPAPNTVKVDTSSNGASTRLDFTSIPAASLPAGSVRPKDLVLQGDPLKELEDSYQKNGVITPEAIPAVKATSLTTTEFIRTQNGQSRGLRARAQGLQAAILDNPNSTTIEQLQARYQVQRMQALQGGGSVGEGGIAPETADLLRDMGKLEGGAMGYEAVNKGVGGDTPGGLPGMTNMTIKELQSNKGINHVGKYQFKLGPGQVLDRLTKDLGLTGNEKFTPELQDRMANEVMWGGRIRPALTAYLKGGGSLEAAARDWGEEWVIGKEGKIDVRPYLKRMRAAYQVRGAGAVGQTANFSKSNVSSVSWETRGRGDSYQSGGVDLFFEDRQFPAVAPGKVHDIGNDPGGYGLFVITEHRDPVTGDTFQLINAHMDAIHVKVGQSIKPGSVLGRQGSTGTTSKYGIASIDPLEPAPRGSKSTQPYRRKQVLRELLAPLGIR